MDELILTEPEVLWHTEKDLATDSEAVGSLHRFARIDVVYSESVDDPTVN